MALYLNFSPTIETCVVFLELLFESVKILLLIYYLFIHWNITCEWNPSNITDIHTWGLSLIVSNVNVQNENSGGRVQITGMSAEGLVCLKGQDLLVVEDILDTGTTLTALLQELRTHNPRSLRVAWCAITSYPPCSPLFWGNIHFLMYIYIRDIRDLRLFCVSFIARLINNSLY